jgi:hypothetical protein
MNGRMSADILQFVRSFGARWFILMSGTPSVPAAIAAFLVDKTARLFLAITVVVCFILAAFFVWREEYKKVISLSHRLMPKFALQYDPQVPMCKSPEIFKDESSQTEGRAFRIQVANVGDETIYGCEARLVELHKMCEPNKMHPTKLMWAGNKFVVDVVKGVPEYIGVLQVLATGEKQIPCEGMAFVHKDIIKDPGEYLFTVVVSASNAPVKEYSIVATLADHWKAADMRPL